MVRETSFKFNWFVSNDLLSKSFDWFLYEGNTGFNGLINETYLDYQSNLKLVPLTIISLW